MPTPSGPLRVVIVDDERIIADTLGEILAEHGLEVTICYEPALAITAGKTLHPHALISDVAMPGMSGFELARHYARHHPECRVLLLSGHASSAQHAREAENGGFVQQYLQKPVHPSVILAFIDSCTTPV